MGYATASLIGGVGLLERAISYSLGSLQLVTPDAMARASPCRQWDLQTLLQHMDDSLSALHEAVDVGHIELAPQSDGDPGMNLVATLRGRACSMLGDWASADDPTWISVGGWPVTAGVVTATGALEIAVHGWDVARACGSPRGIPEALAEELLPLAVLLVTDADRPARFAAPVDAPPPAPAGERLLAFLGRDPG